MQTEPLILASSRARSARLWAVAYYESHGHHDISGVSCPASRREPAGCRQGAGLHAVWGAGTIQPHSHTADRSWSRCRAMCLEMASEFEFGHRWAVLWRLGVASQEVDETSSHSFIFESLVTRTACTQWPPQLNLLEADRFVRITRC